MVPTAFTRFCIEVHVYEPPYQDLYCFQITLHFNKVNFILLIMHMKIFGEYEYNVALDMLQFKYERSRFCVF